MWKDPAKVERLDIRGRRMLAVSDIHANLPYFKALLEKLHFCENDELFIVGDFLEKGEDSLGTLRYVMQLCEAGNVHVVCGNCDFWSDLINAPYHYRNDQLMYYVMHRTGGICRDMLLDTGIEPREDLDFISHIPQLYERYKPEWDFLRSLPQIIETPHYIFVHGGIDPHLPLEAHTAGQCMKNDAFMNQGHRFSKWVIVGHWPVMLYLEDRVCANPIIDKYSRIISLDGGCVLKDDGQLNGLIIPFEGSEDFSFEAYDPFPTATVKDYQPESSRSYYIRWGDNKVQVLERGEEFSRCRHVRTGYEMDILTKYLYSDSEESECNDSTDYRPELFPGDTVSITERTSRGFLIKHNGTSGWYFGDLEE